MSLTAIIALFIVGVVSLVSGLVLFAYRVSPAGSKMSPADKIRALAANRRRERIKSEGLDSARKRRRLSCNSAEMQMLDDIIDELRKEELRR